MYIVSTQLECMKMCLRVSAIESNITPSLFLLCEAVHQLASYSGLHKLHNNNIIMYDYMAIMISHLQ